MQATLKASTAMSLRGFRAGRPSVTRPARVPQGLVVRAQAQSGSTAQKPLDGVAATAANIGLDPREGIFGFRPFAEMWCGRLAMMGFVISIVEEFLTGDGTLAQMRLMQAGQPNYILLVLLCIVFGGATLYGTVDTVTKMRAKQLTSKDIARYKNFLKLDTDGEAVGEAAAMKRRGDFTTPGNNEAAIAQAKAAGSPVDAFLSTNDVAEGEAAARQMKASTSMTREQEVVQGQAAARQARDDYMFGEAAEMRYAKGIELDNGRWAMIGFLAAVLVEAATGNGIIMQIIQYLKWVNILGADSGF